MRTKVNRALTCLLVVAMILGSIHLVAADNQGYDAPDLVLAAGQGEFDLTEDITYDKDRYTLAVIDKGGFNIYEPGSYEVQYALTPIPTQNEKEENQPTEPPKQTETNGGNAGESSNTPEQGGATTSPAPEETGKTEESKTEESKTEQTEAPDPADKQDAAQETVTPAQTESAQSAQAEEAQSLPESADATGTDQNADTQAHTEDASQPAASGQTPTTQDPAGVAEADADLAPIYFTRTVIVMAAEDIEDFALYTQTVDGDYTGEYIVDLHAPLWENDEHKKFQFPFATVTNRNEKAKGIHALTVSFDKNEGDVITTETGDTRIDGAGGNGFTLFYNQPKSAEYIQNVIRGMIFKPYNNVKMNIDFILSGNQTIGFDPENIENLTYNPNNGHYYMLLSDRLGWREAYNRAKTYTFNGQKGYLLTASFGDQEYQFLDQKWGEGLDNGLAVGASRLKDKNDAYPIRDWNRIEAGSWMYSEGYPYIYYNCGPEAGKLYNFRNIVPSEGNDGWVAISIGRMLGLQGTWDSGTENGIWHDGKNSVVVEFGGYPEGQDPGGYTKTLETKVSSNDTVALDAEAMIGPVKYAPLSYALEVAEAKQTVKVVKDTVSADKNVAVKKGVKIQYKDQTNVYTVAENATVDVNANGTITLTDGTLNLFQNAPMQVTSPVDQKTYDVTGPNVLSAIVVDAAAKEAPYITGDDEGKVQIGNVTYSYENTKTVVGTTKTQVRIPDAMVKNEKVTKAEISGNLPGEVRVDDGDKTALITFIQDGGTAAGDAVSKVTRTKTKRAKVDLPKGRIANTFGSVVQTTSETGVTVYQSDSSVNPSYPDRAYVDLTKAGDSVIADGQTYTAKEGETKFFLGEFAVNITGEQSVLVNPDGEDHTKNPAHYKEDYRITIAPKDNFEFDMEKFSVNVKANDKDGTGTTYTKASKGWDQIVTIDEATGKQKVTIHINGVKGDISINPHVKRQMTNLTINVTGNGIYKVVDAEGNECKEATVAGDAAGTKTLSVPKNEPLTITFSPQNFTKPYYSAFTGERGSTFDLLTKLQDVTKADDVKNFDLSAGTGENHDAAGAAEGAPGADGSAGATDPAYKARFDWLPKSYTITYKATEAQNTLEATFTKSHVFRVFLTGGKVTVTKTDGKADGLIHRDHDETGGDAHHIIVPHNTSLRIEMKRKVGAAEKTFNAFWATVSENETQSKGVELPTDHGAKLEGAGTDTVTYTTIPITEPFILNANFEENQPVTVKVTGGSAVSANELPTDFDNNVWKDNLDNAGYPQISVDSNKQDDPDMKARIKPTWTKEGEGTSKTYTVALKYGDRIFAVVKADDPKQKPVKMVVDNIPIDLKSALESKDSKVVVHQAGGETYYVYRSEPIYRAWGAEVVFAKEVPVTFTDGQDTLKDGEQQIKGDTVFRKIPEALFTTAEKAIKALENGTKKFFAWVASGVNTAAGKITQIYTKLTDVERDTDLILDPVFRDNQTKIAIGESGRIAVKDLNVSEAVFQKIRKSEELILDAAAPELFDAKGKPLAYTDAAVHAEWSEELKDITTPEAKRYQNALTISIGEGAGKVSVTVDVNISEAEKAEKPVITGKTAHALTFQGKEDTLYKLVLTDSKAEVGSTTTDATGKGAFIGLRKDTTYTIVNESLGYETTKTLLVDAEEIAKVFALDAEDRTHPNGETGKDEKAENFNVEVTVGADGNYKIMLSREIRRTVEIPDTWENVTLDLNGKTISGADAIAAATADGQTGGAAGTAQSAAAGLRFITDAQASRNPGTTLTVVNGTIQGGNGAAGSMNGAAGVETAADANAPTNAKIIVGAGAKILGGNGANAKDNSGQNGGNGGFGIKGAITVTVLENGIVKGGNGGNGANVTADNETAQPGQGGTGGQGTALTTGTPTGVTQKITDGEKGTDGIKLITPNPPEDKTHTVIFDKNGTEQSFIVKAGEALGETFDQMVTWAEKGGKKLLAWVDNVKNKVYTKFTKIVEQVKLTSLFYDGEVARSADGSYTIAAKAFTVGKADLQTLTDGNLKDLAQVQGYDKDGEWLREDEIQVTGLDALKALQNDVNLGKKDKLISFSIGTEPNTATVSVDVTITEAETTIPVSIIGTTAHTLTIQGRANTTYQVQYTDSKNPLQGEAGTVSTNDNGVGTTAHLAERNTSYTIVNQNKPQEKVTGSTALVDAKLIAERFANQGETTKQTLTQDGNDEAATNSNVTVTRGADGNYTAALQKAIQGTIAIPDTWGTVTLDLNQHTIQGADATNAVKAQVGLIFIADDDESIHVHPGTTLKVINGTIRGGSGSAAHPNGAPAVSTAMNNARMAAAPTNAKIEVGNDAKLIGGQGANAAKNSSQHGGDGGAGITGAIELLVSGGTVKGGDGGNGADADIEAAKPGNGGSGGVGTNVKKVTLQSGAILGGNGGKGGKASGDNKNPGGTGGAGGDGTAGGGENNNNGGNISGGAGGAGGDSSTGNGGQGGQGGNAGNNNNTGGGTENGGNGGSGGSSESGNGGAGGTGGNSGSGNAGAGGTGGNSNTGQGGQGGNGGNSNTGNAGAGGSGGNSNTGQGGAGGDGGSSNTGNGGQGGNGGTSNGSGNGGQGGQGGNSNSGNAGTGGTGGNSNTGQGGNGGNGGQGQKPGAGGTGGTGSNGTNNGSSGKPGTSGGSTGGGSTGGGSGSTGGGTTTKPGGTTTKPGGTTTKPGDSTTTKPGGTTTKPGGTTTKPSGTTTKPSGTTTKPSGTTTKPSGTTTKPSGTTTKPSGTTTNGSGNTTANGSMNGSGNDYNNGYNNGYGNGYDYNNGYNNGYGNGYDYSNGYGNGYDYSNGYGDGSVPAGSDQWTDANGDPVDFWHCTYHWSPLLLLGGLAGYALVRVMQIRGILRRKKQEA